MTEKYGRRVKELMIKEMEDLFGTGKGFVFSSFEKVKASSFDGFRKKVKHAGTKYTIVRKRMGTRAMENAGLAEFKDVFKEEKSIGIMQIKDDPVAVAKLLAEFSKENEGFTVSKGCFEGRVLDPGQIKELAKLPGREQLLAMVARTMNAPVTGFVMCLAGVLRKFCYALNAIKDKKEA